MRRFNVTFEIVTEESAANGESTECGFIGEGMRLRDAIESVFRTDSNTVDGIESIEPSDSDTSRARWVTVMHGMDYMSGDYESRSIHFPRDVTPSTRARLVRMVRG